MSKHERVVNRTGLIVAPGEVWVLRASLFNHLL
jgi:hypothetical protein